MTNEEMQREFFAAVARCENPDLHLSGLTEITTWAERAALQTAAIAFQSWVRIRAVRELAEAKESEKH